MTAAALFGVRSANRRCGIAAAIVRGWITLNAATIKTLSGAFIVIGTLAAFKAWRLNAVVGAVAYWPDRIAAGVWCTRADFACTAAAVDTEQTTGAGGGLRVTGNAAAVYSTDGGCTLAARICTDVADITTSAYAVFAPDAQESTLSVLGTYSTVTVWPADWGDSRAVASSVIDGVTFTAKATGTLIWALWVAFTSSTLTCFGSQMSAIWAGGWVIDITTNTLSIHADRLTGAFAIGVAPST